MSDTTLPAGGGAASTEYVKGYETALAYAWHRFNSYDRQSGMLKARYQRIRLYIIVASLLTTILSVMSVVEDSARYWRLLFLVAGLALFILSLRLILGARSVERASAATMRRMAGVARFLTGRQPATAAQSPAQNPASKRTPRIRSIIAILIGLVLFATGGFFWIVSNGAEEIAATLGGWTILPWMRTLLIMLLIALPLLSAGLLDFAARFESRRNWIGFRLAAEQIRRAIYTLRVRNHYEDLTTADLEGLNTVVKQARETLSELGVTAPMLSEDFNPERELVKPNHVYLPDEDDGYAPLDIEQYFRQRLTPQLNWYRDRIKRDYSRSRYYRGWILLFGGLGSLLTAFNLSEFAAVTAALVTAIVTWLALMAHEQNFRVYASTLAKIEELAADYRIKENTVTKDDIQKFVDDVEQVLADERDNWSQGVLQAQDVIEDNLGRMTRGETGEDLFKPEIGAGAEDGAGDGAGREAPEPAATRRGRQRQSR